MTSAIPGLAILRAESPEHIDQIRKLFLEYAGSLGFSLCFQSFDKELAELPGDYAPPHGILLLAFYDGEPAGCVACHQIDVTVCEMKRLYVRPQFRGKKLGYAMANAVIESAKTSGYTALRLDTVAGKMDDAIAMYRRLGFREIAPYRDNPVAGALYMELTL